MTRRIRVAAGGVSQTAIVADTPAGDALYEALPLDLPYEVWGDEIYAHTDIEIALKNGVEIVDVGALAFWPPGKAFCIFFGPTPASTDERPRAASPVEPLGRLEGDPGEFRNAHGGRLQVEALAEENE